MYRFKINGQFEEISKKISYLEKQGEIEKALNLSKKGLHLAEKSDNFLFMSEFLKDISICYRIKRERKRSLQFIKKSLKIALKYNLDEKIGNAYGNIGILNMMEGGYSKSIRCHWKAIEYHKKTRDIKKIIPNLSFIGMCYLFKKEYKKSKIFLDNALMLSKNITYKEGIYDSFYNLGLYYYETRRYDIAAKFLKKAIKLNKDDSYKLQQYNKLIGNINAILMGEKHGK